MAFFAYQTWYYPSNEMIADGYRVLNAAWRPLYTCGGYPAREIYAWSPNIVRHNGDANINIHLPKSDLFLGPLLSTWEGTEIGHLEILTDRGAAMAERCWNETRRQDMGRLQSPPETNHGAAGGNPISHGRQRGWTYRR